MEKLPSEKNGKEGKSNLKIHQKVCRSTKIIKHLTDS